MRCLPTHMASDHLQRRKAHRPVGKNAQFPACSEVGGAHIAQGRCIAGIGVVEQELLSRGGGGEWWHDER